MKDSPGSLTRPQVTMTETTKFEMGYCDAHPEGCKFVYPPGFANAKSSTHCFLYFRSAVFYREFIRQNAVGVGTIDLDPE